VNYGDPEVMKELLEMENNCVSKGQPFTARGKGDRHLLCEAPEGPFRQKVPVTFSAALPQGVNGHL
jgi:hypothetical protein